MTIKELLTKEHTPISEAIGKFIFSEEEYNSIPKGKLLEINNDSSLNDYFTIIENNYIPELKKFNSIFEEHIKRIWLCSFNDLQKFGEFSDTVLLISKINQNNWEYLKSKIMESSNLDEINKYIIISKTFGESLVESRKLLEIFVKHLEIIKTFIMDDPEDLSLKNIILLIHAYANLMDEFTIASFNQDELKLYSETAERLISLFRFLSENESYENKDDVRKDIMKLTFTMLQVKALATSEN